MHDEHIRKSDHKRSYQIHAHAHRFDNTCGAFSAFRRHDIFASAGKFRKIESLFRFLVSDAVSVAVLSIRFSPAAIENESVLQIVQWEGTALTVKGVGEKLEEKALVVGRILPAKHIKNSAYWTGFLDRTILIRPRRMASWVQTESNIAFFQNPKLKQNSNDCTFKIHLTCSTQTAAKN